VNLGPLIRQCGLKSVNDSRDLAITAAIVLVSYTASSELRMIESVTANEMLSCDWLTAPALLNTSYWSVIYRHKNPSRLPAGRSNIIAIYYH